MSQVASGGRGKRGFGSAPGSTTTCAAYRARPVGRTLRPSACPTRSSGKRGGSLGGTRGVAAGSRHASTFRSTQAGQSHHLLAGCLRPCGPGPPLTTCVLARASCAFFVANGLPRVLLPRGHILAFTFHGSISIQRIDTRAGTCRNRPRLLPLEQATPLTALGAICKVRLTSRHV